MKMSLLCVPRLKGLWAALGCPIEFDWGDAPDKFPKKAEKLFVFFFFKAFIAFIWEQTLSRLAKTRFGNSLVLAFLQAGVTIEAGAS